MASEAPEEPQKWQKPVKKRITDPVERAKELVMRRRQREIVNLMRESLMDASREYARKHGIK